MALRWGNTGLARGGYHLAQGFLEFLAYAALERADFCLGSVWMAFARAAGGRCLLHLSA